MATLKWLGRAAKVAQVTTLTVGGTIEAGDKFIVTINGKSVSVAATNTSASTTAGLIEAALDALDSTLYPEFAEFTASVNGAVVTLTANTEGVPFTVTATTTESNGDPADDQTFVAATTTAATGPNHWDDANNWDTGAVPTTGDTVYIEGPRADILYGLAQSAVTLAALHIRQSYTGTIGLPETNTSGSADYPEYRATYLAISATVLTIGEGPGQGSGRIKIDTGSNATTLTVVDTGSPAEADVPALLWKGAHNSNVVNVYRGSGAAAWLGKETATIATLNCGYTTARESDVSFFCGNVTLTTVVQEGGDLTINTAATTITRRGGTLTVRGSGAVTTVNNWGGTLNWRSSGTVSALYCGVATVDYRGDMRAKTVSACDAYAGATILDPQGIVTWSAGIDLNGCGLTDVTLDVGKNVRITPGAVA